MNITKLKDTLIVLSILGLPIGGSWAVVATFWKSTTGDRPANTHLLLILGASAVSVVAVSVWWIWKQRVEIQKLRADLMDARKPRRFQDECHLDERLPMYCHPSKRGFFCVACAAEKNLETPMQTMEHGWHCPVESAHFVRNPDYREPQHQPIYRPPLGPSDPGFFE